MKTSCSFTKDNLKSFFRPGWKGMGDPGVEEVETRIFVKPGREEKKCEQTLGEAAREEHG